MLPRLPCVVRVAYCLAETGGFDNLGGIKHEPAVLGFGGEMQPPAIPDALKGIPYLQRIVERPFDGQQLLHRRDFSGGAASDGSGQIAGPER
jgi:hypothetical protein